VLPHFDAIEADAHERAFIHESAMMLQRARRRRNLLVGGALFSLAASSAVS